MILLPRNLEDGNGNVCTDLEETFDYLINLWVAGHATWVEAFRIRNGSDFKNIAITKKQEAETMIQEFMNIKENAKPIFCKDTFSGPKVSPIYFSFCCNLGYDASVTITFFIVLMSVALLACCCKVCDDD